MDIINEYLKNKSKNENVMRVVEKIRCKDGFEMSVQASSTHYCIPREDFSWPYESVELGYPNMVEEDIIKYAEDPDGCLTKTVYGYVPIEEVIKIIDKHGGISNM